MKIKQLLGMMALDANANEVGKIDDAEFDPLTLNDVATNLTGKNFKAKADEQKEIMESARSQMGELTVFTDQVDEMMGIKKE